jgi:hypothetical protein
MLSSAPATYLGVYKPGIAESYGPVETYAEAIGRQPNLVLYYNGWGGDFRFLLATTAWTHGATLVVDLDPNGPSVSIANGEQDEYLRSLPSLCLNLAIRWSAASGTR